MREGAPALIYEQTGDFSHVADVRVYATDRPAAQTRLTQFVPFFKFSLRKVSTMPTIDVDFCNSVDNSASRSLVRLFHTLYAEPSGSRQSNNAYKNLFEIIKQVIQKIAPKLPADIREDLLQQRAIRIFKSTSGNIEQFAIARVIAKEKVDSLRNAWIEARLHEPKFVRQLTSSTMSYEEATLHGRLGRWLCACVHNDIRSHFRKVHSKKGEMVALARFEGEFEKDLNEFDGGTSSHRNENQWLSQQPEKTYEQCYLQFIVEVQPILMHVFSRWAATLQPRQAAYWRMFFPTWLRSRIEQREGHGLVMERLRHEHANLVRAVDQLHQAAFESWQKLFHQFHEPATSCIADDVLHWSASHVKKELSCVSKHEDAIVRTIDWLKAFRQLQDHPDYVACRRRHDADSSRMFRRLACMSSQMVEAGTLTQEEHELVTRCIKHICAQKKTPKTAQ